MRNAMTLSAHLPLALLSVGACATEPDSPGPPPTDPAPTWSIDHRTDDGMLMGVWGSRPDDVWVVGGQSDRSLVLHGDGTTWIPMYVPTTGLLHTVYGFTSTDVYAVGERGLILHYDGSAWTKIESGTNATLTGVWGASGDDVWIVGGDMAPDVTSPVVLRGTGGTFERVEIPSELAPEMVFKAHGFSRDEVLFVGTGSTVLRWDGGTWSSDVVPCRDPLFSTWGRGTDDVYAVGGAWEGEILHFDGHRWTEVAALSTGTGLRAVFADADGTIAVGPLAYAFEIDLEGRVATAALPPIESTPYLHAVWGDSAGTTYVVGGDLVDYPDPMSGVIYARR